MDDRWTPGLLVLSLGLAPFGIFAGSANAGQAQPVSVFPIPGTPVASDETTFSFRGLNPKSLGKVMVIGSKTGRVGHRRLRHSDGRGVSVLPKKSFQPGELVRVFTTKEIELANKGDFSVRIGKFYGNEDTAGPGLPVPTDGLNSRPDLKPPILNVMTRNDQAAPGMFFYAPRHDGMTITDGFGRVRWNEPTGARTPGTRINDFRTQTYRGRPVLTYWKGASSVNGFSQVGYYEILNNKYRRIARFTPGNGYGADGHEFRITERDTALVLAYRGVKWDMSSVGGPKDGKVFDNVVQEVDIRTGAVLFEWHALGNVSLESAEKTIPQDGSVWDYFHANSVSDDGDSLLVSARSQSSVYRIDKKDGEIKWQLRGDGRKPETNSFQMGPDTSFSLQHDAVRLPNGDISLFDNANGVGYGPPTNTQASGLVLRLSEENGVRKATKVKRYTHPDGVQALSQAGMQLQPNGNFVIGWGQTPRITEFTPEGEVAFDATFDNSKPPSYRAYKDHWVGLPPNRPAIFSEAEGEGATVWASWNGSTQVTEWRVFTGDSADSLREVRSSAWEELETEITVESVDAKVQVVAYDSEGTKLKESDLVAIGVRSTG